MMSTSRSQHSLTLKLYKQGCLLVLISPYVDCYVLLWICQNECKETGLCSNWDKPGEERDLKSCVLKEKQK